MFKPGTTTLDEFFALVNSGHYNDKSDKEYNFGLHLQEILKRELGVPEAYVNKVSYYAYDKGHAYGYSEVLNVAVGVAEIFS